MKNYPKMFYATEKKLIHKVGYTVALAMMAMAGLYLKEAGVVY